MTTKNKITLLAFTAMLSAAHNTTAEIPATPPIDSLILQVMATGNISSGRLCGGMDDDQIVGGDGANFLRPNTSNFSFGASQGGALMTSSQYPYQFATAPAPNATSLFTSVQGPYQLQGGQPPVASSTNTPSMTTNGGGWMLNIAGGLGNDTMTVPLPTGNASFTNSAGAIPPMTVATPRITGDLGNDLLTTRPAITGDLGNDLLTNRPAITGSAGHDSLIDRQILQMMTTGSFCGDGMDGDDLHGDDGADTLWGDNGTDSFVFGTTTR